MPKLTRLKTSDAVVDHVIELLFDGTLSGGDRIDLDAIAEELGVSRSPVREAMVLLERDGLVEMPYHRGAFVADFSAATIREAFALYGMLSGRTSATVARGRGDELLATLEEQAAHALEARTMASFEERARSFRRTINRAAAGPHLKALLRTFSGLVPAASRLAMESAGTGDEKVLIRRELEAIRDGDARGAATAAMDHIDLIGGRAVDALQRRGVFGPTATSGEPVSSVDLVMHTLDMERTS